MTTQHFTCNDKDDNDEQNRRYRHDILCLYVGTAPYWLFFRAAAGPGMKQG
jgi:hypothetical protein